MAATVRRLVSKKKKRFEWGGFDLDLSYITDRIIAMGYPSESIESLYRNKMSDVQHFLDGLHTDNYKVYNLCAERKYPHDKFHGRVAEFPFYDHQTPSLELGFRFCLDVEEYLESSASHVVVVHCKAGKGRTGTFICIYLIWSGICQSSSEAIQLFGRNRTHDGKGVTIPSQIRYIKCFETALRAFQQTLPADKVTNFSSLIRSNIRAAIPPPRPLILFKIVFSAVPKMDLQGGCEPWVSLTVNDVTVYQSRPLRMIPGKSTTEVPIDNIAVQNEVRVEFFHKNSGHKMFSFVLNTAFIKENVVLWKQDLDRACRDKDNKTFPSNFHITVCFREFSEEDKQRKCVACGMPLKPEDKMICDGDKAWHAGCAKCRDCGCLVGSKVTFEGGQPICAKCCCKPGSSLAAAAFFRFCAGCRGVIDEDKFIEAFDHTWHEYCFCCCECRKMVDPLDCGHDVPHHIKERPAPDRRAKFTIGSRPVDDQRSAKDPSKEPLVLLYCPECDQKRKRAQPVSPTGTGSWKSAAPKTEVKSITPNTARPRMSVSFPSQRPVIPGITQPPVVVPPPTLPAQATQPQPQPQPQRPQIICCKCGKPITENLVKALGKEFHLDCFVCGRCGAKLGGEQFFCGPNNIPLCKACMESVRLANTPTCAKCKLPITEGQYVSTANGANYHQNCFTCHHCGQLLGSQFLTHDGNNYCLKDYATLFGHTCAACGIPITGQYLEVDGKQYHLQCFKCRACHKDISQSQFIRFPTGGFLCPDCARALQARIQAQAQAQAAQAAGQAPAQVPAQAPAQAPAQIPAQQYQPTQPQPQAQIPTQPQAQPYQPAQAPAQIPTQQYSPTQPQPQPIQPQPIQPQAQPQPQPQAQPVQQPQAQAQTQNRIQALTQAQVQLQAQLQNLAQAQSKAQAQAQAFGQAQSCAQAQAQALAQAQAQLPPSSQEQIQALGQAIAQAQSQAQSLAQAQAQAQAQVQAYAQAYAQTQAKAQAVAQALAQLQGQPVQAQPQAQPSST